MMCSMEGTKAKVGGREAKKLINISQSLQKYLIKEKGLKQCLKKRSVKSMKQSEKTVLIVKAAFLKEQKLP